MGKSPAVVWCPECEDWTNGRSINASDHFESNDRHYEEAGIRYHKRYRECQECELAYFTAELTYEELRGLLSDRTSLADANAKLDAIRKGLRAKAR